MIPAYEFSMTGLAAIIGRGARRMWSVWLVYFVAALAYMAIRTSAVGGLLQVRGFELTAYENVLNVFPLVARYLGKLILPVGLSAIYSVLPVHSLFEPMAIIGIISVLVLVGLLVISRSRRAIFFGLLWMCIPLMPVLYMPAISAGGFADRYLYLPSMGFAMVAVLFGEGVLARYRGASVGGALSALVFFLAGSTLLLYTAGSIKRSIVWRDDYSLWSDAVEKSPGSANAQYNLGWKLHKMGRLDEARERYKVALALDFNKDEAHGNLAIIYNAKGEKRRALKHYGEVLRIKPASPKVYYEMATIYQSIGSGTEPIALYKEAIRLNPAYEDAHYNLGWTYQSIGDYANAAAEYNEVIRLNRQSADAHYNLGLVYVRLGVLDKAVVHFKTVMEIAPGYLGARERLEELTASKPDGGVRR
jgi:tetratricopeptide (TPR) repeat protein